MVVLPRGLKIKKAVKFFHGLQDGYALKKEKPRGPERFSTARVLISLNVSGGQTPPCAWATTTND